MNSGISSILSPAKPVSFSHILNTVEALENKGLYKVQQHTIDSMHKAKYYAGPEASVKFIQVSAASVPSPLLKEATCIKTSFCLSQRPGLEREKKLPILLKALKECLQNDASDYFIYTNSDIILAPQFYTFAAKKVKEGYDAIVINRRRVSENYLDQYDYELLVSETGLMHPGYDTFIVKRELLERFELTDICVGVAGACNDFFLNVFVFAQNPILLPKHNLTFHIGYELVKTWGTKNATKHNLKELAALNKKLGPLIDISKFPAAHLPLVVRHFKWLMNPTVSYPMLLKADLKQLFKRRKRGEEGKKDSGNPYHEWMLEKISF